MLLLTPSEVERFTDALRALASAGDVVVNEAGVFPTKTPSPLWSRAALLAALGEENAECEINF